MESVSDSNLSPGTIRRWVRVRIVAGLVLAVSMIAGIAAYVWTPVQSPIQRAKALAKAGQTQAARTLLDSHLQKNPQDNDALIVLARLENQVNPEHALQLYSQVAASNEFYFEAQRQIALLGLTHGLPEAAIAALLKLIEHDPQDVASQLALAEQYFHSGQPAEALPFVRTCLQLKPDRAETLLLYAEILDDLGRTSEMVSPLEQALKLAPEQFAIHANLAYALLEAGELEQARREAEWCLQRDPQARFARKILARVLREQGEFDQALTEARQLLQEVPDDLEMRFLEADLLIYFRHPDQAYQSLLPFYQPGTEDRKLLSYLARTAQLSGNREESLKYLRELEKLIDRASSAPDEISN